MAGILASTLSLAGVAAAASPAGAATGYGFDRLAGVDRYETSAAIAARFSATAGPAITDVILASGESGRTPDALAASFLAGVRSAPVLVTRRDTTPASIRTALEAFRSQGATRLTIVGGPVAVSEAQVTSLRSLGFTTVERHGGADRFETARMIVAAGESPAASNVGLVASGISTIDALAGGPLAYKGKHPVLLVTRDGVPSATLAAIRAAGVTSVYVLGGEAVVGPRVVAQLTAAGVSVTGRLAGADRSETSVRIAEALVSTFGFTDTTFNLASGANEGIDALSGAALSGRENRPLLITNTSSSAPPMVAYASRNNANLNAIGHIFGGTTVVTTALEAQIVAAGGGASAGSITVTAQAGTGANSDDITVRVALTAGAESVVFQRAEVASATATATADMFRTVATQSVTITQEAAEYVDVDVPAGFYRYRAATVRNGTQGDFVEAPNVVESRTTYQNPLAPVVPAGGTVDSCADPMVLKGQDGEMIDGKQVWYMFCTSDPLNDEDINAAGDPIFHRIPMNVSTDLVNWTYVGDAFEQGTADLPSYAEAGAALWAPEVVFSSTFDQYYMFVGVTNTTAEVSGEANCDSDGAIGVATAESPTGPWTFSDEPVVLPRRGGEGCNFKWTYDPDAIGTDTGNLDTLTDTGFFYYGSYYGGVYGTPLTLTAEGADTGGILDDTLVAIDNKYEGAELVYRDGFYYIFLSATNCCNGALTGYSVFVGRSTSPLGPFVDQQGNSLTDAQAGGTPFLTMNGNRWVGTGHNTVFQDEAGQWWTIYHAVDQEDPFYAFAPGSENELGETQLGFTKRPALLDPIDWVNGWPTVNGGAGPSDTEMPAPAAQPGQRSLHSTTLVETQELGQLLADYSDEFDGASLSSAWTWDSGSNATTPVPEHSVAGGVLTVDIQAADTFVDVDNAHVLVREAPGGDYVVETKVRVDIPDEGCCFNFGQAGIGVYGDEDRLVKLTNTSIFNTRQTEWAKEISDEQAPVGWSRYGNTVVGPPSEEWTYLRIVVEQLTSQERTAAAGDTHGYTAYTSQDGTTYVRGGTWTHTLGDAQQIALFAMGLQDAAQDFSAEFDYVRVYTLQHRS